MRPRRATARSPWVARTLARWLLRRTNADLVLSDLDDDYLESRRTRGRLAARARFWRLAVGSVVSSWRGGNRTPAHRHAIGVSTVLADARHAVRVLRGKPAFAVVMVLTLALGVGANAAIFSVLNGLLLRPLPYAEPTAIVNIWQVYRDWQRSDVEAFRAAAERFSASWPVYREWRARNRSFAHISAYGDDARLVERDGAADWVGTIDATASLADVLGVQPAAGRWFRDDEEHVAVVSHGFARRWFGDDEGAMGASIRLTTTPFTVIGVMPPEFYFPSRAHDIWIPLDAERRNERWSSQSMSVVARLADGVQLEWATVEMNEIADAIMRDNPDAIDAGARVLSRVEEVAGDTAPTVLFLTAAVGLVLIVATANVAGLLLVRDSTRRQELMVRVALGAGRARLCLQLVTEGAVLALAGGLAALAVLAATFGWLRALVPPAMPRLNDVVIDWRVGAFVLAVSMVVALVFGVTSAAHAIRQSRLTSLRVDGARTSGSHYGRSALVIGEVAVSVVLVAGAAFLVQSYLRLNAVERGFQSRGVLTATVTAPTAAWSDPDQLQRFYDDVLERVAALPGVTAAGAVSNLPFGGGRSSSGFGLIAAPTVEAETGWSLEQRATAGYFDAMGIRVLRGRNFGPEDRPGAPRSVIVNERFAEVYFPGGDAVGQTIWDEDGPFTIVGVVNQVRHQSLEEEVERKRYTAFSQSRRVQMDLVARTTGEPASLASSLRESVRAVDAQAAVTQVATMDRLIANATALPRFRTLMIGALATIAMLLAAGGVYGVLALSIASRTREIGIRMSLGARGSDVLRQVVRSGLRLILPGVALGTAAAVATGRVLEAYMFQTSVHDAGTLAVVALAVTALAVAATLVPARRAASVDPLVALRAE